MPRTPRNKENKKVKIIEEVKEPEPEPAPAPAPAPEIEPEPEPVAEHRNCLMHEKQSFSSHQAEQDPSTDEELEIPKKRTKQRSEKQLEQLRLAREKSLLNKEMRRKKKRRRTKN